ncbi:hypothetical protein [Haloferula sp. BvORR071]|uniref:hypothetical protein n=1 Tax=Haloferula sp. BvORR071 TaxID=1396141 RepID=UPI00069699E6|nr:hypothetical protein [Haloferula sp. BvORR071]
MALLLASTVASSAVAADWLQPDKAKETPAWGLKHGLQFALYPAGFTEGDGGPRGLIRIGYPNLPDGSYDLINFIAVEPVVGGKKGYSELEKSSIDRRQGKVFTAEADKTAVTALASGAEELSVEVAVEKFDNGAHVRLRLSQRSDSPDELKITVNAEADSAPIESCVITATMGNRARTRLLYLADGPVSSLTLYPDYRSSEFAPHVVYGIEKLAKTAGGDVLVAIANNEEEPAKIATHEQPSFWDFKGSKLTQYWRKPAQQVGPGLECAVNGRFTYWMSRQPIPGGVAFENFELREPFKPDQSVIFGISRKTAPLLLKP